MMGPVRYNPPPGRVTLPVRDHECARYDRCLDVAVANRWRSWTCQGCCRSSATGEHTDWGAAPEELRPQHARAVWPRMTPWEPRRARIPVCLQCGRHGPPHLFFYVRGEPSCVVCAPDLGAPVHPEWEHRCDAAGHVQLGQSMVTVQQLAKLVGMAQPATYHAIRASDLVRYQLARGVLAVPASQLGLAVPPGPQDDEVLAQDAMDFLCDPDGRRERIASLIGGRERLPWLAIAELLIQSCSVSLSRGGAS